MSQQSYPDPRQLLEQFIANLDLHSVRNNGRAIINEQNMNPYQILRNDREVTRMNPIDYLFSHQSSSASLESSGEDHSVTLQRLTQIAGLRTPPNETNPAESNDWRHRLRSQIFPPNRNHLIVSGPSDVARSVNNGHRPWPAQQQQQREHGGHFKTKTVCELECKACCNNVCNRGMRAILLANSKVELYSTDAAPPG